jgi:hypothetical protein
LPKPQSLRQGWTLHEAKGQASSQASDESQEGLLMDWCDLVPEDLGLRQSAWEKRHRILRGLDAGASVKEIARSLKISEGRVGQLAHRARFDVSRGIKAPVLGYLREQTSAQPSDGTKVLFVASANARPVNRTLVYGQHESWV